MELIHEYAARFEDDEGTRYLVRAYGQERTDGTWAGWLEFAPALGDGKPLATGQETSQPNREALAYWASGLEPIYFEGAFGRAK
jgi:hypothetical protein